MGRHEFRIGDRVQLRADGRAMVVDAVIDEPDRSVKYVCVWVKNEEQHRDELHGCRAGFADEAARDGG